MIDGVLVVDKPAGPTSHDVVDVVRRVAGQRRVGHTGTLDPPATGVLVVCLGRATRLARFLQEGTKTYRATVRFGATTTTGDATGEVTAETDTGHLDAADVAEVLRRFEGEVTQVPPMVSAIKVGGRRLYERARRGEQVDRPARTVRIHRIELLDWRPGPPPEADLEVECSAGTYIRTLAEDIGAALGVGAHLGALRRTANGPFTVDEAVPLAVIERADRAQLLDWIRPLEAAVAHLPQVEVGVADARRVVHGQPLPARGITGPFAVTAEGRLLAVYEERSGRARPEVVLVAEPGR